MKRVVGFLVLVLFAVFAAFNAGCGGDPAKSEVPTGAAPHIPKGKAPDKNTSLNK